MWILIVIVIMFLLSSSAAGGAYFYLNRIDSALAALKEGVWKCETAGQPPAVLIQTKVPGVVVFLNGPAQTFLVRRWNSVNYEHHELVDVKTPMLRLMGPSAKIETDKITLTGNGKTLVYTYSGGLDTYTVTGSLWLHAKSMSELSAFFKLPSTSSGMELIKKNPPYDKMN